jgi:hypothetical protein
VTFENNEKNGGKGKYVKYLPFAFTENGVAMLSSVLNSNQAININIQIMRAFTKLRTIIASHKDLSVLFDKLEKRVDKHDEEISLIFEAIQRMITIESKPKEKIGFIV